MTRLLIVLALVLAGCSSRPARRVLPVAVPPAAGLSPVVVQARAEILATNRPPISTWTDSNGCQYVVRSGVTNGPRCFPPVTNITLAWPVQRATNDHGRPGDIRFPSIYAGDSPHPAKWSWITNAGPATQAVVRIDSAAKYFMLGYP